MSDESTNVWSFLGHVATLIFVLVCVFFFAGGPYFILRLIGK